jgi:hypothetical protein
MTDNRDQDHPTETTGKKDQPASMSRRALLKQAGVAMPAVLTLQSGAAMAASSIYVGTTTRWGSHDSGNVYCMDVRNAEPMPNGTTYKFVNTNYADVYVLPDESTYHDAKGNSKNNPGVLSDEFCHVGGSKYYNAPDWPQVDLPENLNGVLVSSTAMTSLSAAMDMQKMIP